MGVSTLAFNTIAFDLSKNITACTHFIQLSLS